MNPDIGGGYVVVGADDIHLSEDVIRSLLDDCVRITLDIESEGTLSDEDAGMLSGWADVVRRCDYEHGLIPDYLDRAYSEHIRSKRDGSGNTRGQE